MNALPVKNQMKNIFWGNQIFTILNLDIAFILLSQKYKVFWGKVIFVQMFIVGVWKVQLQLHGSGNGAVRWQRRAVSHTRPHASTTDTHTHAL